MVPMILHKWVNLAGGLKLLGLLDRKLWKDGLPIKQQVALIVLIPR